MNIFTLVGKIVLDSGAAEKDLTQLKKQAEGAGAEFDDLKKDADETGEKLDKVAKDAKEAGDAIDTAGDKASKSGGKFDDLGKKTSGLASGLGSVAKVAGGFIVAQGLVGLGGFLADAAQGAAEDAAATDRLNKSLENYVERSGIAEKGTENFGYAMYELQDDINSRIEAGARLAFTDDDVRDSLQSLLNATDDYGEATKRQAAAMDLARGANIPLATATRLLGKINEENVDVFKKMGIELAENATEADALAAVQARYGGQAEAYAKSTAGQFEQAKIRVGELEESIGAALLPAITTLMGFLVDTGIPTLEKLANGVLPVVGKVFSTIGEAVRQVHSGFTGFFNDPAVELSEGTPLSRAGARIAQVWVESVQPALKEAIRIFGEVATFIGQHSKEIETVVAFMVDFVITKIEGMIQIIEGLVKVVSGVIELIDALIHGDWARAWEAFKQIVDGILDLLIGSIKYTFGNIPEVVLGLIGEATSAAGKFAQSMFDAIVSILEKLPEKMRRLGRDAANSFLDSISIMGISAGDASHVVGKLVSGFMDDGGVVPGPVGSPQLILAHGGETIIPTHKMSVGAYFAEGSDWVSSAGVSSVSRADRSMSSDEAPFMSGGAGVDMKLYNPTIYATDMNDAKRSFDTLGVGWAYKLSKEGASLP